MPAGSWLGDAALRKSTALPPSGGSATSCRGRIEYDDKLEEVHVGAFLRGPVAITGASGHVGGFLSRRLAEVPNEVRAVGRRDNLTEAFRDADAVVHLAGTLQPLKGNTY